MTIETKIINHLFTYPEIWTHVREVARKLNISPNSVATTIKKLNIIETRKDINALKFRCDLENKDYLKKKKIHNLSKLNNSKLIENLEKEYNSKAIILFGSYSKGEDISSSDIDIAIITNKKEHINLKIFEDELKRKISLSLVDPSYKKISKEFYMSLINGIVLQGRLSYERF